jgi:dihydroorotate dehydrogenase (NAD+) catalytic subunit
MSKPNLSVRFGNLKFKNPVILASGTAGYGHELENYIDLNELGGFITKGIYFNPRAGNPSPRIYETPCGMLNAIGLQGVGVKKFKSEILPFWDKYKTILGVNVAGDDEDEYKRVVEYLENEKRIDFFEINLSCPNVHEGGKSPSWDPKTTYRIIKSIKDISDKPIIAKLSPSVTYIEEIGDSAARGGADGLSLVNTFVGMAIDVKSRKARISNILGGVSGPAIKPMALALVYKLYKTVKIPIMGLGGINSAEDVLEFIIAGASVVQIGTASIIDPAAAVKIIKSLEKEMLELKYKKIDKLIGKMVK